MMSIVGLFMERLGGSEIDLKLALISWQVQFESRVGFAAQGT